VSDLLLKEETKKEELADAKTMRLGLWYEKSEAQKLLSALRS
jgi:hypothetical protein